MSQKESGPADVTYRIRSSRESVHELVKTVLAAVKGKRLAVDLHRLELVLAEALTNALLYGSLEMPSDQRELEGDDAFWQRVAERESDERYGNREIALRVFVGKGALRCRIKDPGSGFDWRSELSPRKTEDGVAPDDLESIPTHRRGIAIMRSYADKLAWNDRGNEVRFSLKLGSEGTGDACE